MTFFGRFFFSAALHRSKETYPTFAISTAISQVRNPVVDPCFGLSILSLKCEIGQKQGLDVLRILKQKTTFVKEGGAMMES